MRKIVEAHVNESVTHGFIKGKSYSLLKDIKYCRVDDEMPDWEDIDDYIEGGFVVFHRGHSFIFDEIDTEKNNPGVWFFFDGDRDKPINMLFIGGKKQDYFELCEMFK